MHSPGLSRKKNSCLYTLLAPGPLVYVVQMKPYLRKERGRGGSKGEGKIYTRSVRTKKLAILWSSPFCRIDIGFSDVPKTARRDT